MGKASLIGAAQLNAALNRATAQIESASDEAVDEAAEELATTMRATVPVDLGELQDGIEVRDAADGTGKEVGAFDVGHAVPVEFGTEDTPAQPFAQPAAEGERQRFPKRVGDKVSKAL